MPRARIWQLIESGGLDFSLSGISNPARDSFPAFAWYFSNKYYLLVRRDAGIQRSKTSRNPKLRLGAIRSFRYNPGANRLSGRSTPTCGELLRHRLAPFTRNLLAGQIHGMMSSPSTTPPSEAPACASRPPSSSSTTRRCPRPDHVAPGHAGCRSGPLAH